MFDSHMIGNDHTVTDEVYLPTPLMNYSDQLCAVEIGDVQNEEKTDVGGL